MTDHSHLDSEIEDAIQERFPGRANDGIRVAIRAALRQGMRAEDLAVPDLWSIRPRIGEDLRAVDIVVDLVGGERD